MPISSDYSIDASKNIRYVGAAHGSSGAGYYPVISFHRWLSDLADDSSYSGDDVLDITKDTPSDRSTDNIITLLNGYNIDQTSSEHLYGGSIIQAGGDEIWDGILVYAASGMNLQIVQNGAILTNAFWNNQPFGASAIGLNADSSNGISHQFMVKVRTGAADIDGRRLIAQTRVWGKTFSEFKINGTSRGNNVAALTYADDLNNTTASATVAGWATISNTAGYQGIDTNYDGAGEYYYSNWTKGVYSINQFYERMKYLSRQGSSSTLYGLSGELFRGITHEVVVDTPTGTFSAFEKITWETGSGQMLAINSPTTATKLWMQLLTGVAPVDNQVLTGITSGATAMVNVTVTDRSLSFPFIGQSTGSSIIGGYGVGIQRASLTSNDKVFDLSNTQYQAPNYVTFTVSNLVAGDAVLVAPDTGSTAINTSQLALASALTGSAVTSVVVSSAIPSDTPASGTIRIKRTSGSYSAHAYTAWSGSTFTIASTNFSANNAASGVDVFVSYIDGVATGSTMSFTAIYSADRSLFVRVRNASGTPKIKTYQTTATLGSAGGSATASRISDE